MINQESNVKFLEIIIICINIKLYIEINLTTSKGILKNNQFNLLIYYNYINKKNIKNIFLQF